MRILIVDREPRRARHLRLLEAGGLAASIETVGDGDEATPALEDAVLVAGADRLPAIAAVTGLAPVIVVGEEAAPADEALRAGAFDYLVDDGGDEHGPRLRRAVARALDHAERARARQRLEAELSARDARLEHQAIELRRRADELARMDRARDELAGYQARDITNPIRRVQRHLAAFLAVAGPLEPSWSAALDDAVIAAERTLRMVLDLMDLDRADRGTLRAAREELDVRVFLERVLTERSRMAKDYQAAVELDVDPQVATVWADPTLLGRALLNLVENALRHSRRGRVVVAARPSAGELRFSVADSAGGVPELLREHIFDKYARLEPGGQQLQRGFGLSFCRAAVLAHQGRIWVEDNPPRGARYCFTLGEPAIERAEERRVA